MLHKYLAVCFDHTNDTNILKPVQHNGMSKIKFFHQTCLSKPGPLNLLCDADNFSKIWIAWGQHEIQHREWRI